MSNNIAPTGTNSSDNAQSNQSVANAVTQTLGQDDFLKLMIAQMQNQDPSQPTDDTQFISELAQFSSLEQMYNVAQSMDNLSNNLQALNLQQLLTQGASLIGKQVTGTDSDNNTVSGIVDSVSLANGFLQLQIGDQTLDMSQVTSITQAPGDSDGSATDG